VWDDVKITFSNVSHPSSSFLYSLPFLLGQRKGLDELLVQCGVCVFDEQESSLVEKARFGLDL
jgi:hypothetical protein